MKRFFFLMLFLHLCREEFKHKERDNETQEETHEDDDMKLRPVSQTRSHNSINGGVCQKYPSPTLKGLVIRKVTGSPNLSGNQNMNVQDNGIKDEIAIDIDKLSSYENDKNKKEVEDSKVDLTTFRASPRNVTEPGTCEIKNQMEVENKKDHSDTISNSSETDVIKSEGNYANPESLKEMLLKYLEPMLWKDHTQCADRNDLKKDCQPTWVDFDPCQWKELREKKSELEDYFDRFIQTAKGKLGEITSAMPEAVSFVSYMGLLPTDPFKFTRKMFFYAFFINLFLLQWKSSEREPTFKNCYSEVKDDLIVLQKQIPFSILKKVHGWIAETFKAEKTIPDLTDLILHCLLDQNCSTSLNDESNDVSHLLELVYKAYTKNWGTTKACIDTQKKAGFCCAKDLKESGVKFEVKYTDDLLDISFEDGTLKVPFVITDKRFLSILRNFVLHEKRMGKNKPFTSLVCFLKCLIQTEDDIRILHNAGIKEMALNDRELPKTLSDICASAGLDSQCHQLSGVFYKIDRFYLDKKNKWWYDYYKNYWYDPRAIMISVIGAVFFGIYVFNSTANAYHCFHGKKP